MIYCTVYERFGTSINSFTRYYHTNNSTKRELSAGKHELVSWFLSQLICRIEKLHSNSIIIAILCFFRSTCKFGLYIYTTWPSGISVNNFVIRNLSFLKIFSDDYIYFLHLACTNILIRLQRNPFLSSGSCEHM